MARNGQAQQQSLSKPPKQPEHELRRILITLIGGSNSGKTTFLGGIYQAMVANSLRINNNTNRLSLRPVSIRNCIVESDGDTYRDIEVSRINNSEKAGDVFGAMANGFNMNAAPADTSAGSFHSDSRPVEDVTIDGSTSAYNVENGMKIFGEMSRSFAIHEKFKGPTQTTRYIECTFEVMINGRAMCLLSITDYAGELIDQKKQHPAEVLGTLAKHIYQSDASIILASARDMSGHIADVYDATQSMFKEIPTRRALSADNINGIFSYMSNASEHRDFTVLLAVTQTDSPQIDHRVSENKFTRASSDLKKYIFSLMFDNALDFEWSNGVIPVSAIGRNKDGRPNVDMNNILLPDADVHQEDIDTAVIFCLYNAVLQHESRLLGEIKTLGNCFLKSKDDKKRLETITMQYNDLVYIRRVIMSDRERFKNIFEPVCVRENIVSVGEVTISGIKT